MVFEKSFFHKFTNPLIIAGPCSAESEYQLMKTAEGLTEIESVKFFRAGVWKPRTQPGSFEGKGEKALSWLKKVEKDTGLIPMTEVATPLQAKIAIELGLNTLWIGARTTGNPIYVQEIADELKNKDINILIKNPLHPDIDLWCGAIKRFYEAGIKNIAAVHRGFYPYEKTAFRNLPLWEIPIELQLRNKSLPIFNDPSHISGKTSHLPTIMQHSLDLNMTGFMIETHYKPPVALTDKEQQITPLELKNLLNKTEVRKRKFRDNAYNEKIDHLREEIDQIDFQLLDLLKQRNSIVGKIAECKKDMNVSVLQLRRWEKILKTRLEYAENNGISRDFILKMLQWIHKEAIRTQTAIMNSSGSQGNAEQNEKS